MVLTRFFIHIRRFARYTQNNIMKYITESRVSCCISGLPCVVDRCSQALYSERQSKIDSMMRITVQYHTTQCVPSKGSASAQMKRPSIGWFVPINCSFGRPNRRPIVSASPMVRKVFQVCEHISIKQWKLWRYHKTYKEGENVFRVPIHGVETKFKDDYTQRYQVSYALLISRIDSP
jgi:hypothetical protein